MARPVDQETIAIDEIICYSQFPGGRAPHAGPMPGNPGSVRRQRGQKGNVCKSLYCGFHKKLEVRQGKQA